MKYSRIKLVSPKNKDQTGRKESPLKEIKENNRRVLQ